MEWKKETYDILLFKDGQFYIETVEGQTTELNGGKLGIHKSEPSVWKITDLATGSFVFCDATRKAARQWVEDYREVVEKFFTSEKYKERLEGARQCQKRAIRLK